MTTIHEVDRLSQKVEQGDYQILGLDLDETLARVNVPWDEWNQWLVERWSDKDLRPRFREAYKQKHYVPGDLLNLQLARGGISEFITAAEAYEEQCYEGYTPYDRLVEAVPRLGQLGVKLYLWTNNARPIATRVLEDMGIASHFQGMVTRSDVDFAKPSPEGWERIQEDSGEPGKGLMVGDGRNDRLAAEAAGIEFFYIDYFRNGPGAKQPV